MKTFRRSFLVLLFTAAWSTLGGCATNVAKKEDMLSASGFRIFVAKKPAELALLKNLPPDKISPVTVHRHTYFVFPDPKNNRVYAGNAAELSRYQKLRVRRKLAAEQVETERLDNATNFGAWGAINYGWYSF